MSKVMKKILFYIDVKFVSPVSVSNGNIEKTDGDVLRDFDGNPFISGASLAGAMRGYLKKDKTDQCIFGYAGNKSDEFGKMSSLYLSDLTFKKPEKIRVVVRDGVGLSEGKTALTNAKYDMEAIDTGAEGSFIMELIVRENDLENEENMLSQIYQVLYGIEQGEIRLGNKKTRGYGEMTLKAVRRKEYTANNILEYVNAYNAEADYGNPEECKEICLQKANKEEMHYLHIEVPLKLTGGICIRQYSSKKGEPDMVHITANDKPVIPGTSFTGAIRSRMKEILRMLFNDTYTTEQIDQVIKELWGYVDKENARRSYITIGESILEGAVSVRSVRTGVSRFESAAKSGALREERIYTGGTTALKINVSKEAEWAMGLLILVVKEIQNGYLPVGGQTAVGRGVFEGNGSITIDKMEIDENEYLQNFQNHIEGGMKA